jgi:hypothetical protein
MKPRIAWLSADAELLLRVKRTITSEKRMLIVFWGIQGIKHYSSLPKESILNSTFFCKEVLDPIARKLQPNSKKIRDRLTVIHMDNAQIQKSGETGRTRQISFSGLAITLGKSCEPQFVSS